MSPIWNQQINISNTTSMVSTTPVPGQKYKNCRSQQEEQQPQQICQSLLLRHHHISLLSFLLFLLFLASCTAGAHAQRRGPKTYPLLASIPETAFRCQERNAGYYADMETGCQVYHMCDTREKQFSYLCPNHTLFNQKFMVCDHWYMVNCTMSDTFFELNDHIGEVPDKGVNTVNGGINEGNRKSTILSQKPQSVHQIKAIVPVSMKKFPGATKTTNVSSTRPILRSANVPVTIPKSPNTTKSSTKTTKRPPITQNPLFTIKQFVSTTQRPLSTFSNLVFNRSPSPVPSLNKTSTTTSNSAGGSVFSSSSLTLSTTPKSTRTSLLNRNTFKSSTTPKPTRTSILNRNTQATTTPSNPARTFVFNRNSLTTTSRPTVATTKKPFTSIFPGNVTRSPGSSFSFAQVKLHNLTITRQQLEGRVFRPLVVNPFIINNRSSIPSFTISSLSKPLSSNLKRHPLVTTPNSLEEESDQTSQHSTQQFLAAPLRALDVPSKPFGMPVPNRLLDLPPFSGSTNNLPELSTTVIEPPTARRKGTSPVKFSASVFANPKVVRTNPGQETPLTPFTQKPPKFLPFGISEEVIPGVLHVSFQSARGNRDFFIPSSGLTLPDETLPVPSNSLSSKDDNDDHDHNDNASHTEHDTHNIGDLHMTMLFPGSSGTPLISTLVFNPQCPHCHPAFLRPGHCTPCVRIRR